RTPLLARPNLDRLRGKAKVSAIALRQLVELLGANAFLALRVEICIGSRPIFPDEGRIVCLNALLGPGSRSFVWHSAAAEQYASDQQSQSPAALCCHAPALD